MDRPFIFLTLIGIPFDFANLKYPHDKIRPNENYRQDKVYKQ